MKRMIFEAKKDTFFSTIFYGVLAVLLTSAVVVYNTIQESQDWWGFTILIVITLLIIWMWYGTVYKISNNVLNITSGPVKKNIHVRAIRLVEIGKTKWVGFKFGLSKGGVIVHYNEYDEVYITPENAEEFCKALKRIHSDIEIAKNID